MIKKIFIGCAAAMLFTATAYAEGEIYICKNTINISGTEYTLENQAFTRNGEVYVPLDEILPKCGFSLGWDNALKGTVCESAEADKAIVLSEQNTHIIGYRMYRYENPVINIGDLCYINEALLEDITGYEVNFEDAVNDFAQVSVGDEFRKSGAVENYGEVSVINRNFGFESVEIGNMNAEFYAAIVNQIAAKLPGVNVYNMLIPDASEIYAPKEYCTNQTASFAYIASKLDENVTYVNVIDELYAHAGEDIYFRTDHHWTQRGAYYAWKAFMNVKGESVAELGEFVKSDGYGFSGSYITMLNGINAFDNPTETIERFMPRYDLSLNIYGDMYMNNWIASSKVVNDGVDNYNCFIGGDNPIVHISGGVQNGRKLVIMKESFGNALATWAANNYEDVYVVDIRKFYDGSFDIATFRAITGFDDLLIASYPTSIESSDLRIGLLSLKGE